MCVLDLNSLNVCPPFGKKAKFEVEIIQTKSLMYGCAYMGNDILLSTAPLFHLWLERPKTFRHGHCENTHSTYYESLLLQHSRGKC